ncbi:type ISP restriction/modification enzyme [uncultured Draconibacterium sp.]|uniref:type ISP restriction/modification enzyme n=1 Tax=uncultured Draconibacterium sp. TaxID=1573823 RepID=UPI0032176952
MTISEYISQLNTRFVSGISREHSYRGDLETLLRQLAKDVEITNEPANVTDCGNPDYVITKGKIPVGYIEAKDIGKDLNHKQYKEQFGRYKRALDNLIITDYLWFQFFKEGELVHEIRIGEIEDNKIKPLSENFAEFANRIADFCTYIGQTIRSSKKLAEMMAAKARLLQNILEKALSDDEQSAENTSLRGQFETFKNILIHDLDAKSFADIYAQTLAYGMFAARLHDTTPDDFSRYEAAELIPKTNPFLKKLFTYVAGPDIDERIKRTVDNLALVFRAVKDLDGLLHNFGRSTQTQDPIIHFYETFLAEYDPKLRKARGVWYTPEPVVKFIVRAVDDILKTEFNLPQGLADTSKTKIKVRTQTADKRTASGYKEAEQEVHKVQLLDPATGTGTFLAEVVNYVYSKKFKAMQGAWSAYVDEHLIPRLNGFELLMASYAMAHLKLDMLLRDTGYKPTTSQRFNIYLTNSLEEHHPDTGTLFSNWLSTEANEANHIKRDTPVMCVIGNPPYSVSSTNKSVWIEKLMKDYKKNLNERNIQPLSDDYIKFIRYGQYYVEKNGEGILAYISNNSFIDGLIHRQMRKNLMETFDKIYILDLHGNSKKKETTPDGQPDKNVFDIMQGVSINIFVKTKKKGSQVLHTDVFGSRNEKYDFLNTNSIDSIVWNDLELKAPNLFFTKKDFQEIEQYEKGFKADDLFIRFNNGVETGKDDFFYAQTKTELINKVNGAFQNKEDAILKFKITDTSSFKFLQKFKTSYYCDNLIRTINYRPFDIIQCYYDWQLQRRPAYSTMRNMFEENIALLVPRQVANNFEHVFISKYLTDCNLTGTAKRFGSAPIFPLYIYNGEKGQNIIENNTQRTPNLNPKIVEQIATKLGLAFVPEKEDGTTTFAPIDILDYIYAVLHSPAYRAKYKEFLKIDFPRVPYPKNKQHFWHLTELGGQLREIHLLESRLVEQAITTYPEAGTNEVDKPVFKISPPGQEGGVRQLTDGVVGQVYINSTQYFANVPQSAWEFYIGGYQPAQKWLKDRKGRTLTFHEIEHYQKIIVALTETGRLMKDIDLVGVE